MIRNKHLQEKIYGREMTQSDYKKLYLDVRDDDMIQVSHNPKIDNVGEYYLTREQVKFLDCFGSVLVKKEQHRKNGYFLKV